MQLRKAHADAFRKLDLKFAKRKRRLAKPVDMRTNIFFANGLGACGFHRIAFGRSGESAVRRFEGNAQGLTDDGAHLAFDENPRFELVVMIGKRGIADAEDAVALPHALANGYAHGALLGQSCALERFGEVAAVGPKLENVAVVKGNLGLDFGDAAFDARNAANENAPVVRTAVAHDFIAALIGEISSGETARERLGKLRKLGTSRLGLGTRKKTIEHGTINRHHRIHVVGRLHAPFDF